MISKSLLRSGDLLFYRPTKKSGISAWFITWAQNVIGKSPIHGPGYCHVALIDEDTDYLFEARWPKTRRWKINWKKLDKHYKIELWRVRKGNVEKVKKVVKWCSENLGLFYDIGLFIWGLFDFKHAEVCSTFVSKAWAEAGVVFKETKMIAGGALITPDEIIGNNQDILKRIA